MAKTLCLLLTTFILGPIGFPQSATGRNGPDTWNDMRFLLGSWSLSEGGGAPGQATFASASFTLELQGRVLVRKSHSEYAAVNGRPPLVHDDLMTIYHDGGTTRAVYFDSEGHVIRYEVTIATDKKKIIFLSERTTMTPRFRLTYEEVKPGAVRIAFEIALPDQPEQFKMYLAGTMVR